MAENKINTLLGYEDELITEKYHSFVNFATNKFGGKPDLPSNVKLDPPKCPLCRLPRLLVLQIYAPIETTTYHRTLYLFACINPNCWNQNDSWVCLRSQTLEQVSNISISDEETSMSTTTINQQTSKVTDWCADADEWDDDVNANLNEENGNVIGGNKVVQINSDLHHLLSDTYQVVEIHMLLLLLIILLQVVGSDEEEESCSLEESVLRVGMEFLSVTDERNANSGEAQEFCGAGAMGCLHSPCARAELEGGEGDDVISIDSPTRPQTDITSLLRQTAPLPNVDINCQQFTPYFISVAEETTNQNYQIIPDRHIRDLLQTYHQQTSPDEALAQTNQTGAGSSSSSPNDPMMTSAEKYEESIPAHGDKMFHYYTTKIQENPGQVMRYARGSTTPLLLYPLAQLPKLCSHCNEVMVFEMQVLPTLIQRLRLESSVSEQQQGACAILRDDVTRLEWGNVLVYTCRKSCWGTDVDFRDECVIVQKELY